MNEFNLRGTIRFLLKYWKVLVIVFFAAALVTGGISLCFKNHFKAQVTLLAADTNSISKGALSQMDVADPLNFGTEKEAEHVLELLNSGKIMGEVIKKFDLKNHYGIRGEGEELETKLGRKLYNNIKIKRTENLGIKLTVWDTDPKYAADIANYIVERLTFLRTEMKRDKMDSISASVSRSRQRIVDEISMLSDSLSVLSSQYKVFYPDGEAERLAQEISKQVAAGNNAAVARLDKRGEALQQGGAKINNIREQLAYKQIILKQWSEQLEKAIVDATANIPTEFVVEYAYPSYFKDKPKRSIITLFSALCCTLLAVAVLVIKDKTKAVRAE
ncbi:MAG: hypothetical protein LBO06_02025 [Bacteroidales bacterium]|nr:hypothetical protein [Bacteroidales bacterium]